MLGRGSILRGSFESLALGYPQGSARCHRLVRICGGLSVFEKRRIFTATVSRLVLPRSKAGSTRLDNRGLNPASTIDEVCMSDYQILVVLRRDLTSRQLKCVGKAIEDLQDEAESNNSGVLCDALTLNDSVQGELPMPMAVRESIGSFNIPDAYMELLKQRGGNPSAISEEELESLGVGFRAPKQGAIRDARQGLGDAAALRGVSVWYPRGAEGDFAALVKLLKQRLPVSLIDDVFIDGVSWNQDG